MGTIATHTDEAEKRDGSDLVKDEATVALQVFATPIMSKYSFNNTRIADKGAGQFKHMLRNSTNYLLVIIC